MPASCAASASARSRPRRRARRRPGRVDDVVAVGRAGRACRRGQVQVGDAEVAQVRDQRAGGVEAEGRVQLQAVGGAELASSEPLQHDDGPGHHVDLLRARRTRRCRAAPSGRRWTARAPSGAPSLARQHERPVLVVGVEQQHERVVDDRPRRAGREWGSRAPLRNIADATARRAASRRWVILRPSGRNHQTSGSPVPSISWPRGRSRGGTPDARGAARSAAGELAQLRLVLVIGPSRTRRARCPGTRRCCCRAGCGRTRRRRAASACPARAAASSGSCAAGARAARGSRGRRSALDAAVPRAVVVGAVVVVLEVGLVVLVVVGDEVARA